MNTSNENTKSNNKIWLLGGNERACFSVAKSLKKLDYHITVLDSEKKAIRYSKYVDDFICFEADITRDIFSVKIELLQLLENQQPTFLFPITDLALQFCNFFRDELVKYTKLLNVNDKTSLKYATNKFELLEMAKKIGVLTPKLILVETIEQFNRIKQDLSFPLIVKPIQSKKIIDGHIINFTVKKIDNLDALENLVRGKINMVSLMLQEIIEGHGAGFNILAKDGEIINSYAHERINEAYGGGQSTFRKSIPNNKYQLEEISTPLIRKIKWSGIAMIEYKIDLKGEPYLMELNGRPWGSIEVGIKAGCDLPADLVKVFVKHQKVEQNSFNEVFVRNWFNEAIWVLKSKPPIKIFIWPFKLLIHLRKNYYIEDNLFSDFRFRSRYILNLGLKALRRFNRKYKREFSKLPIFKKVDLQNVKSIGFLCTGNINRSAFAEQYFKQQVANDIKVYSYGTINELYRMSPNEAVSAARELRVDLSLHKSQCISAKALEEMDKLIIMDDRNLVDLHKLGLTDNSKIFKLQSAPIEDPYGKKIENYKECFLQIKKCLDTIILNKQNN